MARKVPSLDTPLRVPSAGFLISCSYERFLPGTCRELSSPQTHIWGDGQSPAKVSCLVSSVFFSLSKSPTACAGRTSSLLSVVGRACLETGRPRSWDSSLIRHRIVHPKRCPHSFSSLNTFLGSRKNFPEKWNQQLEHILQISSLAGAWLDAVCVPAEGEA